LCFHSSSFFQNLFLFSTIAPDWFRKFVVNPARSAFPHFPPLWRTRAKIITKQQREGGACVVVDDFRRAGVVVEAGAIETLLCE
jgi:hypothetical protein